MSVETLDVGYVMQLAALAGCTIASRPPNDNIIKYITKLTFSFNGMLTYEPTLKLN
jgi:hypothetical protein